MILTVEEIDNIAEVTGEREGAHAFAVALEAKLIEKLCAVVEMPEAVANVSASSNGCIGFVKPDKNYYTADQLRAYGAACRVKALKDAAELCDRFAERDMHPAECAAAIRALKGEA